MVMSITKNKDNMRCFSQVCHTMYKSTEKTTKFKTHIIIWTIYKHLLKHMNIPSNLNDIQSIFTQVFNCDEIGFDPNGK